MGLGADMYRTGILAFSLLVMVTVCLSTNDVHKSRFIVSADPSAPIRIGDPSVPIHATEHLPPLIQDALSEESTDQFNNGARLHPSKNRHHLKSSYVHLYLLSSLFGHEITNIYHFFGFLLWLVTFEA